MKIAPALAPARRYLSMSLLVIIGLLVLAILLLASAFFSSSETVFFSLNPMQVQRIVKEHPKVGRRLEATLASPTQLLSTIIIGNTLVNVSASSLGFVLAEHLAPGYGEIVSIAAMTFLLLIVGEVAPKRIAIKHASGIVPYYLLPINALIRLLTPVRLMLESLTSLFRETFSRRKPGLSEDEFLTGIEVGEEEGVLDQEERTMVDGIIRLEDIQAGDVMTPRVDVIGLDLDDSGEKHRDIARRVTFRYLPVYQGSLDHPRGFLDVPRFLMSDSDDVSAQMDTVSYVPETAPLDTLLSTMQREQHRVAIVVDEFGGTAGLITRGDILEEIVEDVDNEYGETKPSIQLLRESVWLVNGNTSLEDIEYDLAVELEAEGADRIAGWVAAQLERIPKMGDVVEAQGCRVTVQRVRRNRVTDVLIETGIDTSENDKAEQ